ncbi:MAG TPA: NUDIX hydrolase [Phycisphaerales bacterium]|nr:NUDIX hydrolase [Phycisphaerales bacterium]
MATKGTYTYDWPRPMLTVDAVVYALVDGRIKLLLIQRGKKPFKGRWAFPGGYLELDEELKDAATRELQEETGLAGVTLEQMHAFGTLGRDPRGRTISVVYLGRVPPDRMDVRAGDDAAAAQWFDAEDLPPMAFDHDRIAAMALERIRERHDESNPSRDRAR